MWPAAAELQMFDLRQRRRVNGLLLDAVAAGPSQLLWWTWLRDGRTMALVLSTGVYHWQPLATPAPPPSLVLAAAADAPVQAGPGLVISSYDVDHPQNPTWLLLTYRAARGGADPPPTTILHNLARRGHQRLPALAASFATLFASGRASGAPPGPPTHLILAAVTVAAGSAETTVTHRSCPRPRGVTRARMWNSDLKPPPPPPTPSGWSCPSPPPKKKLVLAGLEAYGGAPPYPRRRFRTPALDVAQGRPLLWAALSHGVLALATEEYVRHHAERRHIVRTASSSSALRAHG